MIEAMISMAIFSIGLLGCSLLLMRSVSATASAEWRRVAVYQASSMVDWLNHQKDNVELYFSQPSLPVSRDCTSDCTARQLADHQWSVWLNYIADRLPQGTAVICRDGSSDDGTIDDSKCSDSGPVLVKVFWTDIRSEVIDQRIVLETGL